MKSKPRWLVAEKPNQVAVLARNVSNVDDCEVFMVDLRQESNDKMILEGCIEAANVVTGLSEIGQYIENKIFYYTPDNGTKIGISIPSQKRSKQFDNRFELLAEILAMNGINFRRPAMEVYEL